MNNPVYAALLIGAYRNNEPPVADGHDLFLQLRRIRRAPYHAFELFGQTRSRYGKNPADSRQFRAVPVIDFAILNCPLEMLTELTEIRNALAGLGELRKLFPLFFPTQTQTFDVGQK